MQNEPSNSLPSPGEMQVFVLMGRKPASASKAKRRLEG